jgi:uncharacterized protein (DUF1015 family)
MAQIFPFRSYRYSEKAGRLENLVTQPYDKVSPEMQARYLALSPHNLVRILLGERFPSDSETENVYTRASQHLNKWITDGILVRDAEPSLFAYFQDFSVPDTGQKLIRKGFVGLGPVEDYPAGVVYRHEQTLSAPKKDRLELLRHTQAHFGQLFMLYPDPQGEVDRILDEVSQAAPTAAVTDEYQGWHRLWKICDPERVALIQQRMSDKKLLIADGHHRYETALAFRNEHPELEDARKVMMTFVNMNSPGLKILATHRLVGRAEVEGFLAKARKLFRLEDAGSLEALRRLWDDPHPGRIRIGVALEGIETIHLLEADRREAQLDVAFLHEKVLTGVLGINQEAVRSEQNLRYVRGADVALGEVRRGAAQIAFLLEPTSVEDVARIAFSGGVMPQKSTDFYPKLLSGLTIYRLEK